MEQQEQQEMQNTTSPRTASTPRGFTRCHARNRSGSQCRLPAQDLSTGLCRRHASCVSKNTVMLDDTTDLSQEIFNPDTEVLNNTEGINGVLSNIVTLVAEGRLSPRRAAVMTYALSHILRSVVIMDRQADATPQFILNAPRPMADDPKPAASGENETATAAFARLST